MTTNDYKRIGAQIREERRAVWKLLGEPDMRNLGATPKGRQMSMSWTQAAYVWDSVLVTMFPMKWHKNWRPWQDFVSEKRKKDFLWFETGWKMPPNPPTPAAQEPSR